MEAVHPFTRRRIRSRDNLSLGWAGVRKRHPSEDVRSRSPDALYGRDVTGHAELNVVRAKDLTAGSGLEFEDAGLRELNGIPDAWHLFRVVNAAT